MFLVRERILLRLQSQEVVTRIALRDYTVLGPQHALAFHFAALYLLVELIDKLIAGNSCPLLLHGAILISTRFEIIDRPFVVFNA